MLTGTRRTVLMLAGCQALSMTGGSIVGLTGAIVGNMLTPDKTLSTLPIAVQQVTPVATSQDGRNFFRVEARLAETDGLRPGMEGVAKVDIGRRRLIWIWTHGLMDWLRIFAWKQAP